MEMLGEHSESRRLSEIIIDNIAVAVGEQNVLGLSISQCSSSQQVEDKDGRAGTSLMLGQS